MVRAGGGHQRQHYYGDKGQCFFLHIFIILELRSKVVFHFIFLFSGVQSLKRQIALLALWAVVKTNVLSPCLLLVIVLP